jgi:hypothetical protein
MLFPTVITTLILTVSTIASLTTFFSKHVYFPGRLLTNWNLYVTDWYILNIIFKDEVGLHVLQAGQVSEVNIIRLLVVSPEFH